MNREEEMTDTELIHEALACSVRQRSILNLVERRCAHRELNAQLQREKRAQKKRGGRDTDTPEDQSAA